MTTHQHWEHVYRTKSQHELSWFQPEPTRSLRLVDEYASDRNAHVLDVGAGSSTFVDGLLARGYTKLTVLDIAPSALAHAQQRLGDAADRVHWLVGDALSVPLEAATVDVWHDRAVFHFQTTDHDRARYHAQLTHALRPGGVVIIATFAADGPLRCSGLDVTRYAPQALADALGPAFTLLTNERDEHLTPWGAPQAFSYCVFRYAA